MNVLFVTDVLRCFIELGFGIPEHLHLVPVDFEANESWLEHLVRAGFEPRTPTLVASLGVAMYLTKEAIAAMLRQAANLAQGSTFVMSFIRPFAQVEPDVRPGGRAGRARGRYAIPWLLRAARHTRAGSGRRLRERGARVGGGAQRALLRRPTRLR